MEHGQPTESKFLASLLLCVEKKYRQMSKAAPHLVNLIENLSPSEMLLVNGEKNLAVLLVSKTSLDKYNNFEKESFDKISLISR